MMTTIKHVSGDALASNNTLGSTTGGVNKLGATLPLPGTAAAATFSFKIDDRAIPQKIMPERARRARKEVKKRTGQGPLTLQDRDWANSTYVDGSKFSKRFSEKMLSNSAAPFNITALDHLEAQASTVINYNGGLGSRSIVFSKTFLHTKWNNASKIDRNSIEAALELKTGRALENTGKKCQQLKSYDTPWQAEQKFMDTAREEKLNKKKERQMLEQTYGNEALAYVDKLEETKRNLARSNTKVFAPDLPTKSPFKPPDMSTLKGRTLQKYKCHVDDVAQLDDWEKNLLDLQAQKENEE